MKFTLILIFCFFLVGPVMAKAENTLEPLVGVNVDNQTIHFKVKSTGCTSGENFKVQQTPLGDIEQISILRTKVDRCRRMPSYLWLSLPIDSVSNTFVITNPFKVVN